MRPPPVYIRPGATLIQKIDKTELIGLYARGLEVSEVAGTLGCSVQYVYNVLAENAFPLRSRVLPYRLASVNWSEVIKDYEGVDMRVVDVCKKHSIRITELYAFLAMRPDIARRKDRGFQYGKPRSGRQELTLGRAPKLLPNERLNGAVNDYVAKVRVKDILITHRISNLTLYRELALRGIPLRHSRRK